MKTSSHYSVGRSALSRLKACKNDMSKNPRPSKKVQNIKEVLPESFDIGFDPSEFCRMNFKFHVCSSKKICLSINAESNIKYHLLTLIFIE